MSIRKPPICLSAVVALAVLLAPQAADAAPQRDSRTKQLDREVAVEGRTVSLATSSADIHVVPSNDDVARITVDLEYWSNDEDWMTAVDEEFTIEVDEGSRRISFEPTPLPDLGRQSWFQRLFSSRRVSFELDVTLSVPRGTTVSVGNRYGDVIVDAIGGAAEINNSSGLVELSSAVGDVRIENRYGDVRVNDIDGNLELNVASGALTIDTVTGNATVVNSYGDVGLRNVDGAARINVTSGSVSAEGIGGEADISASYGRVEAMTIGGALTVEATSGAVTVRGAGNGLDLRNSYDSIDVDGVTGDAVIRGTSSEGEVRNVSGSLRLQNSYGAVVVEDIGGTVDIDNPSGNVTINGAGGDAHVSSSYSAVRALRVGGNFEAEGTSMSVVAEEVDGGVDISTSYDGVTLRGVGGAVRVANQSGAVTVTGLTGEALHARHVVETSYANIDFDFPAAGSAPAFELECTYGRISSDFEGAREERGSSQSMRSESGGEASISLTARNGSVTLRRR